MSGTTVDAGKLLIAVEATTENLKRQLDQALAAVNAATTGMAQSVTKVDDAFGSLSKVVEGAGSVFQKLLSSMSPVAGSMVGVIAAGTGLERMFEKIGEAAIDSAKALVEAGDEHRLLIAQLQAVTGSLETATEAFDKLEALTLQTGVAVGQSADMFKRLTIAGQEVGLTTDEVQQLVKTLEEAGVTAGASGDQISSVVNSLTVGLLSGTVNARQFRSIITEMPSLATALADSLGVSVSKLMDMAKHGQLTADMMKEGILGAATDIEAKFEKMPETMGRAWGELEGGMGQLLGAMDNALGISQHIALVWHDIAAAAAAWAGFIKGPDKLEAVANNLEKQKEELKSINDEIERRAAGKQDSLKPDSFTATVDPMLRDQSVNFFSQKTDAQMLADKNKVLTLIKEGQDEQYQMLKDEGTKATVADQAAHATAAANLDDHNKDILNKLQTSYDKRFAIQQKYDDQSKQLDTVQASLVQGQDNTQKLADIEKARAGILKEEQDALAAVDAAESKHNKTSEEAAKRMQDVADASALAAQKAQDLFDAFGKGADATERANADAMINNDLKRAGLTDTLNLNDAQRVLANSIIDSDNKTAHYNQALKDLNAQHEANNKALDQAKQKNEEYQRELEQTTKDIATQISSSLYDELTNAKKGQSFLDYFKGLFKKLAVEAATANIVMPIIAPIVQAGAGILGVGQAGGGNQIFNAAGQVIGTVGGMAGGTAGGTAGGGVGGLMGSGSVLSNLFSAGSLANTVSGGSIFSSIGSSLGLTGPGNLLGSGGFLGSGGAVSSFLASGIGGTSTAEAAASAASNAFAPAATGLFGGASVGSALGGVGAGFAAGTLLNSLVGGKQVGGTIGSGVGAVAGTVAGLALTPVLGPFGPLIGGLIGGAAGGGLGGLIGPGPKNQYSDINVGTAGGLIDITKAIGNDKGTQDLITATANSAAAANALATQFGLAISGGQWIGKGISAPVGPDAAFNLGKFQFSATGSTDPGLNAALAQQGGVFQSVDDLTKFVTFVTGSYTSLQKTADATNQFDQQIDAINKTYADAIATAQSYGLATDKLVATQQDAVTKINAAHQLAINQLQGGADISLLTAQGRTYEAQTYGLGSGKQPQLDALTKQLTDLGLSASDAAPWVQKLSDAIDLQIQSVKDANALQILTVEAQSQIDAKTAQGLTTAAAQQKTWIDNASAIKNLTDTLTALGVSAYDAKPYIDNLTASLAAQTLAQQAATAQSITDLQTATQIRYEAALGVNDPAMKAAADLGTLIASQFKDAENLYNQLTALGATTDQVTQALGVLSSAQKIERDNLTATAAATNTAGQSIQAYLDKLNQTGAGGASPTNQYAAAKQIFGDQLALAQGGNADALANITGNAEALLSAAKGMFGSGQGYQDVVSFVKSSLTGLPATTSYDAQVLAALQALGGGINVDVSLAVIRSISETLNALPPSEANKLQVTESILHTVEEQMGRQLTTAEFDRLMEVQGVSPIVEQTVNQVLNGLSAPALVQIEEIAGLDPTVAQRVVQEMESLTPPQFEQIATVAGLDPKVTQTLEQKMTSLTAPEFANVATVAGVDPSIIQAILQKMTPLSSADFDRVAQIENLSPTVTQTVKQLLYALASNDWTQIAAAEHIDPSIIQAVTQALNPLKPDQLAQIGAIQTLPTSVNQTVTQKLTTTGDAPITPVPITKQITQNVTTSEQVELTISDQLGTLFQSQYNQQTQMIQYLFAISNNTWDAAHGSYGFAKGGVFSGGQVLPYARGGVVTIPTYAPIALFGEAGPEAIMPLQRDAAGRLGVAASNGKSDDSGEMIAAFAQIGIALRDEMRLMRGDIQDVRATLRRAVAQ